MKKRMGFVSNSSSSSFCILGKSYDSGELVTLWNTNHLDDPVDDLWELKGKVRDLDFVYGIEEYYDMYIVGKSIGSIDQNRTINDQKVEIAKKINEAFGTSISEQDINFHVDGGRDS